MHWKEFPEEFPIAEGCTVGTIRFHQVLVVLADFHDYAHFVPFEGVWTSLILDMDMVTNLESGQASCVL